MERLGNEKEILIASWNMWDFVDGFGQWKECSLSITFLCQK